MKRLILAGIVLMLVLPFAAFAGAGTEESDGDFIVGISNRARNRHGQPENSHALMGSGV